MNNALYYSLQVLLVIAAGALLPIVFRLALPSARLWYWQGLLGVCLLLPAVQPRHVSRIDFTIEDGPLQPGVPVKTSPAKPLPAAEILLTIYAAGVTLRAAWLLLGFWRLRSFRRNARDLYPVSPSLFAAQKALGVFPDIQFSDEVNSPVTFGFTQPVILLPPGFLDLDPGAQEAIAVHELIHVQRRDWIYSISEEIVRAVFWFHPAIWWLLGQIQLTREQVVDRATVEFTLSREQYLEALLAVAKTKVRPDLALAPLFLKKRHLAQRVAAVMNEVYMSKRRIVSSLATVFTLALLTARVAVWVFPLESSAQDVQWNQGTGVTVDTQGHKLLHGSRTEYPRAAREKKIEGTVVLQLSLDPKGEVADARVLSGPDELRSAALSSALQWHFQNESGQAGNIQASINFKDTGSPLNSNRSYPRVPGSVPAGVLKRIVLDVPDTMVEDLRRLLPVHEGETLTSESLERTLAAIRSVDEHLSLNLQTGHNDNSTVAVISLATPGQPMRTLAEPQADFDPPSGNTKRVRIGGNIQAAKLIKKTTPAYPPLAKQARIQGTVRYNVLIGTDGFIQKMQLVSGHPLLVEAATTAVQQWQYQPTLLNGEPAEVVTVIDVNFTLSQ